MSGVRFLIIYRWTFYGRKWFMDRYWFKVWRNIYDNLWKSISWSFSYDRSRLAMKHLLDLQWWHLFKYAELTKIVGQNDKLSTDLLNKVRVGKINDDVEKLLKARFTYESDENYPEYVLQMMSSDVLPSRKY